MSNHYKLGEEAKNEDEDNHLVGQLKKKGESYLLKQDIDLYDYYRFLQRDIIDFNEEVGNILDDITPIDSNKLRRSYLRKVRSYYLDPFSEFLKRNKESAFYNSLSTQAEQYASLLFLQRF